MALGPDQRRDLLSIIALATGAFLGLSLIPTSLTGPLGRLIRGVLITYLGAGAAVIPLGLLLVGLAGFDRVPRLDLRRSTILGLGLVLLIPYAIAVASGLSRANQLPPDHLDWTFWHKAIGVIPAALAVGITSIVGTAGAILVGGLALSALTLATTGWHPLRRLAKRPTDSAYPPPVDEPAPAAATLVPLAPAVMTRRARISLKRTREPEREEQAFIVGEAIKPFPLECMHPPRREHVEEDEAELDRLGSVLIDTLKTFRVEAELGAHRSTGPVVTQFEVAPAPGVKVGRIAALSDDLALKMEAKSIRIVAPIPGKSFVGVEVPNPTARIVTLRELLSPPHWNNARQGLPIALGKDLEGRPVMADLTQMPHLLIAGATGSGKSVCINTIITSLVFRYTERELRLLMIDPKMVELTTYNALPHLIHPVVTNNKDAAKALKWGMYEMEDRYALFSVNNVRNLHEFNRKVKEGKNVVMPRPPGQAGDDEEDTDQEDLFKGPDVVPYTGSTLPYVVVIVDELADLMMTVQNEVEKPLAILAQKARATGIHLVLATQRPSVNVITGLIKANFPCRIGFRVASKVDSRTILDQNGAEALLGNGDMLFLPPGRSEPVRLQGAFIGTDETERVTEWYREQVELRRAVEKGEAEPAAEAADILAIVQAREILEERGSGDGQGAGDPGDRDPLFKQAAETCIQQQLGSTSLLQRRLRIGYGRAARIIDQLHDAGILGPPDGSKPREVLIGAHQLDEYCDG